VTAQNVIFVVALVALALICLFHLNFILTHVGISLGCAAAGLGGLYHLTRNGSIDWDEWIPKGRD
jgi:hypothetical protein